MISVNVYINNFTVTIKSDILVKSSPRFATELSARFTFIYLLYCIKLLPEYHVLFTNSPEDNADPDFEDLSYY